MSDNTECDIESAPVAGGPRTDAGKRRTRFNAVKHGVFAKAILLPDESPAQFYELRKDLWDEFQPQSASAVEDVEHLASLYWRRRRIAAAERARIVQYIRSFITGDEAGARLGRGGQETDAPTQIEENSASLRAVASAVLLGEAGESLMRVRAHLDREIDRTLDRLERTRRRQEGRPEPPTVKLELAS